MPFRIAKTGLCIPYNDSGGVGFSDADVALYTMPMGLFGGGESGVLRGFLTRLLGRASGPTVKALAGLSESEQAIAGNARAIYGSDALAALRAGNAAGQSAEVTVGGTTIVYAPELGASGMTLFGENGFIRGRAAFA